jgi:hypothetical protein
MELFGITLWQALPIFVIGWIFGVTSLWRYRPICTRNHMDELDRDYSPPALKVKFPARIKR